MRITRTRSPERYFPSVLREMSDGRRNQWKAVNQAILKHAADFIEDLVKKLEVEQTWTWSSNPHCFDESFATVYLHFDSENRLIYVGETLRGLQRQLEHKRTKTWYQDVVTTRLVHVTNKNAARELESFLIKTLKPVMNIASNSEALITRAHIEEAKACAHDDPETFVAFMDRASVTNRLLASEVRMVERFRRQVNASMKQSVDAA